MTRPRAALVNEVAFHLGILVAGDTLAAEDYQAIDSRITGIFENLQQRGVFSVPDYQEIDDAAFDPLSRIIAVRLRAGFSVPLSAMEGFESEPLRSEVELRVIRRGTTTGDVIRFQNF